MAGSENEKKHINDVRRAVRNCIEWACQTALSDIRSDLLVLDSAGPKREPSHEEPRKPS